MVVAEMLRYRVPKMAILAWLLLGFSTNTAQVEDWPSPQPLQPKPCVPSPGLPSRVLKSWQDLDFLELFAGAGEVSRALEAPHYTL